MCKKEKIALDARIRDKRLAQSRSTDYSKNFARNGFIEKRRPLALGVGGINPRAFSMENIVKVAARPDPFSRVPKDLLNDPSISWRAKGILAYLIGKPKDWKMRVTDIQKHGREGEDAIRSALMELREAGYAELVRIREKGKTKEWLWRISDSKYFSPYKKPSPDPENPDLAKPHLANQHHNKKDLKKKESTEIDEQMATEEDCRIARELWEQARQRIRGEFQESELSFQKPISRDEDL